MNEELKQYALKDKDKNLQNQPNKMKTLPTQTENPTGLHQRFIIHKIVPNPHFGVKTTDTFMGTDNTPEFLYEEVNPNAEYFILRLDEGGRDPKHIEACRIGVLAYAEAIKDHISDLAKDLKERYSLQSAPEGMEEVFERDEFGYPDVHMSPSQFIDKARIILNGIYSTYLEYYKEVQTIASEENEENVCDRCNGFTVIEQGGDTIDCTYCHGTGSAPPKRELDTEAFVEYIEQGVIFGDCNFLDLIHANIESSPTERFSRDEMIEFAEWIDSNGYVQHHDYIGEWKNAHDENSERYTTSELLNTFTADKK